MATNEGRRPVPRAIIEVRNLRKEYPVEDETVVALDRVNLSIPQGQICCIFGESGSGKSTLLNQLAGMEKPTHGGVRIGGVPVSKLDERELAAFRQKHLGFVFQSYNLLPNLTALENVAMPLMFRGVPKEQRERAARGVNYIRSISCFIYCHYIYSVISFIISCHSIPFCFIQIILPINSIISKSYFAYT